MSARNDRMRSGFTLIELIVTCAVLAVLAGLTMSVLSRIRTAADATRCANAMRQLGAAIMLHCQDHDGQYPRSSHSAFANRDPGWIRTLAPYLGGRKGATRTEAQELMAEACSCPADESGGGVSYGLNVYYELNPNADDYAGKPQTWRRQLNVPSPTRTVLAAEVNSGVDHVMAHFWEGDDTATEVAVKRHNGKANYVFADGHVELLEFRETYRPSVGVDRWNPGKAGDIGSGMNL